MSRNTALPCIPGLEPAKGQGQQRAHTTTIQKVISPDL